MGKLPKDRWEDYLNWVNDLEYVRFGLPKPDLVLYLELPIEVSCRLLEKRYAGDDSKKDLHERDSAYLRACHETASFAARRLGWQVVHCGDGTEGIRTPEEIANEIEALVTQRFFKEA
jgi:dTMP kinase